LFVEPRNWDAHSGTVRSQFNGVDREDRLVMTRKAEVEGKANDASAPEARRIGADGQLPPHKAKHPGRRTCRGVCGAVDPVFTGSQAVPLPACL